MTQDQINIRDNSFSFYFISAYNVAFKVMTTQLVNDDLINWIDYQQKKEKEQQRQKQQLPENQQQQQYHCTSNDQWNKHLINFEENLFARLNWNTDLVTASDYLNYFLDNHFSDSLPSDFNATACDADILACFVRKMPDSCMLISSQLKSGHKWDSSSIAVGCLGHQLRQCKDQTSFRYLIFLILHAYTDDLKKIDCPFDFNQFEEVMQKLFIEAKQALSSPQRNLISSFEFKKEEQEEQKKLTSALSEVENVRSEVDRESQLPAGGKRNKSNSELDIESQKAVDDLMIPIQTIADQGQPINMLRLSRHSVISSYHQIEEGMTSPNKKRVFSEMESQTSPKRSHSAVSTDYGMPTIAQEKQSRFNEFSEPRARKSLEDSSSAASTVRKIESQRQSNFSSLIKKKRKTQIQLASLFSGAEYNAPMSPS